ncbi:MAG: hypothetical protein K2L77_09360 [Muribaculaceae bacterium]|nr:hypothetical protein [Muribaculaceae bacterium]
MLPPPPRTPRAPWWFVAIVILVALTTFTFIPQASDILERAGWLGTAYVGWLYPAYVAISGICACMCYPARKTVAWILVALIVVTDAGLFITAAL